MKNSKVLLAGAVAQVLSAAVVTAFAGEAPPDRPHALLEQLVITASRLDVAEIGGSVQFLDTEVLDTFSYRDINRVLRQVPGVYIQEEDGVGLRPNIGIRGSGNDRNGKISVMEDGVLIAPAPYAASAAYYFPQLARMSAVEIVKGPAAIKYGPSTTGGAISMFSTPIPEPGLGNLEVLGGGDGGLRGHGVVGGWIDRDGGANVGLMLEALHDQSDGFKRLDSGGDTGYRLNDYVGKLAFRSAPSARLQQSFELKMQSYDESSDETYLGLTLADFNADPYRRYSGSQVDRMEVEHKTFQATHRIDLSETLALTTVAYHTETARAWYKLNDVLGAGSLRSLSAVLDNPALYSDAMQTLRGASGYTSPVNALRVRNNNREYYTSGIQSVLATQFSAGAVGHELELSVRYHEDEEDRFQQDDRYQMRNGVMVLTAAGAPGSQENRVVGAAAWAFFIRDAMEWDNWTVVPGLRYESIDLKRTDYSLSDPARTTATQVLDSTVDVWIPGVSATYRLADGLRFVGGAHRGFTNPAPGSTADAETSWSYEAGLRFESGAASLETIAFYNDYSNLVGTCTGSTGGGCNIGDQFDGGEVEVLGLEATLAFEAGSLNGGAIAVPLSLVYTYTQAEFQSDFVSSYGPWGTVRAGDELPYLPNHQFTVNAGLDAQRWRANVTLNYVDTTRAVSGSGPIAAGQRIDERLLVDLSGEVSLVDGIAFFASVQNATDKVYNVAFAPAGARPGAPRTLMGGFRFDF